jgi:hypothetical protein
MIRSKRGGYWSCLSCVKKEILSIQATHLSSVLRVIYACTITVIHCGGLYPAVAQKLCPVSTGVVMLHTTRQWCCYILWNFVWLTRRGTGTAHPSEHLSSSPVFSGARVTRSLVLGVMFCRSLFVPLSFFVWPVLLRFMDSSDPFGIFELFLLCIVNL